MSTIDRGEPSSAGGARLDVIDGLRGIAIALVVAYHLWPGLVRPVALTIVPRTGWIGVDLFFFISGFAIFYPYARTAIDGRPEQTLRAFALRRFAKIVPSYALSIVAMIVLGMATTTPGTSLGTQVIAHALFVHDWFEQTTDGINGVLWSLAVEVQFYVVFAATRSLALRSPLGYATGLIAIALAFRLWIAIGLGGRAPMLLDELPANLDLFGTGIACAYVYRYVESRRQPWLRRRELWTALAGAACLCTYGLLFYLQDAPGLAGSAIDAAMHVFEAMLFLALGLGSLFGNRAWRRFVANRLTLYLAGISYNLYLWHQAIYLALVHRFGDARGDRLSHVGIAVSSLACSLVLTTLLTVRFERPLQLRLRIFERRPDNSVARL